MDHAVDGAEEYSIRILRKVSTKDLHQFNGSSMQGMEGEAYSA
jgi:hypothetical protein